MVWNMPTSSFLFYYVLPWTSFLFVVIYGIFWAMSKR